MLNLLHSAMPEKKARLNFHDCHLLLRLMHIVINSLGSKPNPIKFDRGTIFLRYL